MPTLQFLFLCFCLCLLLLTVEPKPSSTSEACRKQQNIRGNVSIGVVIDSRSRVGKEQKVAIELAVKEFRHCLNIVLHIKDSRGSSARAASAAIDLVSHHQVNAILGSLTLQETALVSEFKTVPIISLSTSVSSPQQTVPKLRNFIQMNSPITYQVQCMAASIGHFKWRKVLLIHEQGSTFSEDSGLFTLLSDALRAVDASVERHVAFPRISSLSDPKALIDQELRKLRSTNVRVFMVGQSSLEFSGMLFERAKVLGMMEKGYIWIVSDEIASLLDSVDSSVILNMQGVVGLKTEYEDKSKHFGKFKSRFRRKYGSRHPLEEESSSPSIYSLRAYDAVFALVKALQSSEENVDPRELVDHIWSSDFKGLSGRISFKNGFLSQEPVFRIVNVIGKSYREIAMWQPLIGFSQDLVEFDGKRMGSGRLSLIYWPGGELVVPNGLSMGSKEKPLRIGVPAKGAFKHFVNVAYDPIKNQTRISGFSIEVFEAAVKELPYVLHYVFVPYYGTYDEMVAEVHNKSLDAAVGDTEIMADRYVYAIFSQPYIESGLQMIVTTKPSLKESRFIALDPFTRKMWLQLAGMSISTGAIIWLTEYTTGNEQFIKSSFLEIIGAILWLSVTIISLSQKQEIKNFASHLVLASWICLVFVVGASFTAVLSTMMTVPRLQPSIQEIEYLRNTNAAVGCNGNSFIVKYLINVLNFKPENVRKINSIYEYPKAFENGEIKAAFFVAPHAKVFLAEYCRGYTTSGPSFKLGGFGFVFQKGSFLETDISEAILKVTQSGYVNKLEQNMLHLSNCTSSTIRDQADDLRLDSKPFSGMFQLLGGIIVVAFVIAIVRLVRKKCTIVLYLLVLKVLILKRSICMWT